MFTINTSSNFFIENQTLDFINKRIKKDNVIKKKYCLVNIGCENLKLKVFETNVRKNETQYLMHKCIKHEYSVSAFYQPNFQYNIYSAVSYFILGKQFV